MSYCSCYFYPKLPKKFGKFILNGKSQDDKKRALFQKLEKIFYKRTTNLSELGFRGYAKSKHIFTHKQLSCWFFKIRRHDERQKCVNQHVYRVSRAEKIRKYIATNGFEKYFVVPKKYLYQYTTTEWMVVSERIHLRHQSQYALSLQAAKSFARLITEAHLIDVHSNNMPLSKEGKIAIIDTEPLGRHLKQNLAQYRFFLFDIKPSIHQTIAKRQLSKLIELCQGKKDVINEIKWVKIRYETITYIKYHLPKIIIVTTCILAFLIFFMPGDKLTHMPFSFLSSIILMSLLVNIPQILCYIKEKYYPTKHKRQSIEMQNISLKYPEGIK